MVRVARDSVPRRRSSRISSQNSARKASTSKLVLDSVAERDETPDTEQPCIDGLILTPSTVHDTSAPRVASTAVTTPQTEPRVLPEQMHPATIHQTLSKHFSPGIELDMRTIHTESAKPSIESLQGTPSRPKSVHRVRPVARPSTAPRQSMARTNISPGFQFKFAHESNMSEEGRKLMDTIRDEATRIKEQMRADKELQDQKEAEADGLRRIAKPVGKSGRFSEVHLEQFKKMDSIVNHASAYRAAPTFARPTQQSLKRSSSKANLDDRPQTAGKSPQRHIPPPVTGRPYSVSPFKSIRQVGKEEPSQETKKARKNGDTDVTSGRPTSIPKPLPSFMSPTKASVGKIENVSTSPPKSSTFKSTHTVAPASAASSRLSQAQPGIGKPLPVVPDSRTGSLKKTPLSPFRSIVYPERGEMSTKSRLPMFAGLKSILKSAKKEHVFKSGTPQKAEPAPVMDGSARKVDFTPSVKSRYAVKLATGSPSPAKLDRLVSADHFEPAIPYDPSVFRNHYIGHDDDDDDWEDAEEEASYPSLPAVPVNRTFSQYAHEHNRRASKEFKSIFTNIHPVRRSPPTGLTAANTAVNRTDPLAHTIKMTKSPERSVASPGSTIRRVRTSEPIVPFEDASIPTVPHGLPGKRRRHESDFANDKYGADEDAKENLRISHALNVPGTWHESGADLDEGDQRAGKRVRRTEPMTRPATASDSDDGTIPVKTASPVKKSTARELAARTAKDRKKGRQSMGGALSMSRLNALAKPKRRV